MPRQTKDAIHTKKIYDEATNQRGKARWTRKELMAEQVWAENQLENSRRMAWNKHSGNRDIRSLVFFIGTGGNG